MKHLTLKIEENYVTYKKSIYNSKLAHNAVSNFSIFIGCKLVLPLSYSSTHIHSFIRCGFLSISLNVYSSTNNGS